MIKHTCDNGHKLAINNIQTDPRMSGKNKPKCEMCRRKIHRIGLDNFIACTQSCKMAYCLDCMCCPSGHILDFAIVKRAGSDSELTIRRCNRCNKDLTQETSFKMCRACNLSFCVD